MWFAATTTTKSAAASHGQALFCATVVAATGAAWYSSRVLLEEASGEDDSNGNANSNNSNPIEIDLMDKIANKIYLNPARAVARNQRRLAAANGGSFPAHSRNSSTAVLLDPESSSRRPLGVPSRLRILAIDLPEIRTQAFSQGTCRVAFDRVFPNGVAPPTYVPQSTGNGVDDGTGKDGTVVPKRGNSSATNTNGHNKKVQLVEQKAFVQSMLCCFQQQQDSQNSNTNKSAYHNKVGVEVMEASFADLNPRNLRKTRQVGGYHYDPGKYASDTTSQHDREMGKSTESANVSKNNRNDPTTNNKRQESVEEYHIQHDDESDAPWNQYAWMEELKMRVGHTILYATASA